MTTELAPGSLGLHPAARQLILAAHRGEPADFGINYGRLLADPELAAITRDVLAILAAMVRSWLPAGAGPADAIEAIHAKVAAAYPRCCRLLGVNLVLLEHLARSLLGLSGFLRTLDGDSACLYGALLVGSVLAEPVELAEFSEPADG